MRPGLIAASIVALAFTPQSRGVVTDVVANPAKDEVGAFLFTVRGKNPCGAVRLDPGEGGGITHPIHAVPTTLKHEYSQTGTFTVTAEGMGNCDGVVRTTVTVTSVRPRPVVEPPPPPPVPTPTPTRTPPPFTDWTEARFNSIDRNRDTRITMSEWRFGSEEFKRVDRNGDSFLTLREFLRGAEGTPQQGTATRRPGDTLGISARTPWTDTGITVRAGDLIVIRVDGVIQWAGDRTATAGPNGVAGRPAAERAPVPYADLGALVGRVANGAPFVVGGRTEPLRMPTAGRLYLGVNDDVLTDNQGEFFVTISVGRGGR